MKIQSRLELSKSKVYFSSPAALTVLGDHVEKACVPMEYHKDVMDQRKSPENIWIVCVALRPVYVGPKLVDFDQPCAAQDGVEAN